MSGYGRGVAEDEGLQISFELRSVNHRFFRLGLHLPARLAFFETTARQFHELVDEHTEVPWRDFLLAWGELREADILRRDNDGNYYIGEPKGA